MNATTHAPSAEELALLRHSVRNTVNSLSSSPPDERWPDSWQTNWAELDRQGLWSTLQPPDGSLAAAAVVVEELGRGLYPGPGCEALAATCVSGLSDGRLTVFATDGDPMVAVPPDAVVIAPTAGGDVAAVPAGDVDFTAVASLDVTRRMVTPRLHTQPGTMNTAADSARRLLYCADTLGCIDHVVARTAEYARQRTTFGAPIGKYQAVAHRLVDHAVTARQMRLVLNSAIEAFDAQASDLDLRVATAETFFWGRAADIVSDCIQLCGAIAFTWEFGHHFYVRRVVQNAAVGGRPHRRLAQEAPW